MTAPCLALVDLADPELNFEVHTDASNHALGGALLVEQKRDGSPWHITVKSLAPQRPTTIPLSGRCSWL